MDRIEQLNYFERIFTKRCLTDRRFLSSVEGYIREDIFSDKALYTACNSSAKFYRRLGTIPNASELILESGKLADDILSAIKITREIEDDFNEDNLFDEAEKFLKERYIHANLMSVADDITENNLDTSKVLPKFEESCKISLMTSPGISLFGDIEEICKEIAKPMNYISSGYDYIDERLGGGFSKDGKALYMFAGPPNVGKSIFLGQMSKNIARQGYNILEVTLEMSEIICAKRRLSSITQIEQDQMISLIADVETQTTLAQKQEGYGDIFIKEFPTSSLTILQLKSYIEKLIQIKGDIDCVVLDYLNIMKAVEGDNSYEKGKILCEQLRALTYYFGIPFISATQFNRSAAGAENPGMELLSESYGVAMTADVIFSIFRTPSDYENNFIKLGTARNRYGTTNGIAIFECNFGTMTLDQYEEIDEDEDEEDSTSASIKAFQTTPSNNTLTFN